MKEKCKKILKKINDAGFEAYIVGGFVRDMCLGIISNDVDICTSATVYDLKKIFKSVSLIKEKYGTLTVYFQKSRFEITTFRTEEEYFDRRHPSTINYTNNLFQDLLRRDFTINTLCLDCNLRIIDLLDGKKDIDNKIIRTVGNADKKLSEDPLRILRAIRFAGTLDFQLDIDITLAIKNHSNSIKNLSFYRKKQELERIFSSKKANKCIELLKELKLLDVLEINFKNLVITQDIYGIWSQLDYSSEYSFSKHEKRIIENVRKIIKNKKIRNVDLYYKDLYVCSIAAEVLGINKNTIVKMYNELPIHSVKDINITAFEICDILNMVKKNKLSIIINDLVNKILSQKLNNQKEIIIDYLIKKYRRYYE